VSRGTIQCRWLHKSFDDCKKLGLTSDDQAKFREKGLEGMLVAESVLPGGPSEGGIKEGDILTKVNGELSTGFKQLEESLDCSVGERVTLSVQRGDAASDIEIEVGDLHNITPNRFVNACGGVFHMLSYQMATEHRVAVEGVVYAGEYGMGTTFYPSLCRSGKILSVDQKKVANLEHLMEVLRNIPGTVSPPPGGQFSSGV
jgi:hypothetical protein